MAEEKPIGEVTHYYNKIGVAVVKLTAGSLKVGQTIHIQGHSTDFVQEVSSMEIQHKNIQEAKVGDEFGLKVDQPARGGDKVYLVADAS
jgi:translation elongation factor EF-1alpha